MADSSPNYTIIRQIKEWDVMFYLWHRLGIQSSVLVSGRYEGGDLTKSTILTALRTVVLRHSALWHVWVHRPCPRRKGQHVLDLAAINVVDLEDLVEVIDDDGQGLSPAFLETYHNEWLWTADQPDKPWWKLVVKGRDLVFIYHHVVGDGMSGYVFHREFLDALNSADASIPTPVGTTTGGCVLRRADHEWRVPPNALNVWEGTLSIIELLWTNLYWIIILAWYGNSHIYATFPLPKPLPHDNVAVVARPADRTVGRFVSHRIPAAKMARILAACRENGVTFTPLFMTMLTVVLSSEFNPTAKLGVSRYAYDLRPQLPMDKVQGGTRNGVIFNGAGGGQHAHRDLSAYRKAIPFDEEATPKIPTVRDAPIIPMVVWPLVSNYSRMMKKMVYGKGTRIWSSMRILPSTLEGFIAQTWSSIHRTLPPTHFVSNLGPFSPDPVTGEKDEGPKTWRITDSQFCAGPTNANVGSRGVGFSIGGVKGGDTVVHGGYQEGMMSREEAEDVVERVMARIYELVGV